MSNLQSRKVDTGAGAYMVIQTPSGEVRKTAHSFRDRPGCLIGVWKNNAPTGWVVVTDDEATMVVLDDVAPGKWKFFLGENCFLLDVQNGVVQTVVCD